MSYKNNMRIQFLNKSANEGFARVAVAAFVTQLDVTVEQLADIKTAVSDDTVKISVSDCGRGISDINLARQPLYTSRPELERSGMGFTVMETFMDTVDVQSALGMGTTVKMTKKLQG